MKNYISLLITLVTFFTVLNVEHVFGVTYRSVNSRAAPPPGVVIITKPVQACQSHCRTFGQYARDQNDNCNKCCTRTQPANSKGICQPGNPGPECHCSYYNITNNKPALLDGECSSFCDDALVPPATRRELCTKCCKNFVANVKEGFCKRKGIYRLGGKTGCYCKPSAPTKQSVFRSIPRSRRRVKGLRRSY